jgi:hypothetical protein
MKQVPLKQQQPPTRLNKVTTQKTTIGTTDADVGTVIAKDSESKSIVSSLCAFQVMLCLKNASQNDALTQTLYGHWSANSPSTSTF